TVQNAGQPPANIKAPPGMGKDEQETMERLRRRQRLFYALEDNFSESQFPHLAKPEEREAVGSAAQAHTAVYKKGFDLTVSPLRTAFEINKEPAKVVEAYGGRQNGFGMGCLLARKLVEKGVTCIEVDIGGWDNHQNIFNALKGTGNNMGLATRLDKGMGT